MKKIISYIVAAAMLTGLLTCGVFSADYSGAVNDSIEWSLNTSTGVLTLSGVGKMSNYAVSSIDENAAVFSGITPPWYQYRENVRTIYIGSGIINVGAYAFACLGNLETVTFPSTVYSISSYAFAYCTRLKNAALPGELEDIASYAFYDCGMLLSVTVPEYVSSVGKYAFCGCGASSVINIGGALSLIGENAFARNYNARSVNVSPTNIYFTDVDGVMFTKQGDVLVMYPPAKGDTSYTVPDDVEIIADGAFQDCAYLRRISFPDSLESIRKNAFARCALLENIDLPESVSEIGARSFSGCTRLSVITGGGGLSIIGREAFDETKWLSSQKDGAVYFGNFLYTCKGVINDSEIYIKNGTKYICEGAFENRTEITKVTLPRSLRAIYAGAFAGCSGIESKIYLCREADVRRILVYGSNDYFTSAGSLFMTYGDVNNESGINSADILVMRLFVSGDPEIRVNLTAADLNLDGSVSSADILLIRLYVSGDKTVFEP